MKDWSFKLGLFFCCSRLKFQAQTLRCNICPVPNLSISSLVAWILARSASRSMDCLLTLELQVWSLTHLFCLNLVTVSLNQNRSNTLWGHLPRKSKLKEMRLVVSRPVAVLLAWRKAPSAMALFRCATFPWASVIYPEITNNKPNAVEFLKLSHCLR